MKFNTKLGGQPMAPKLNDPETFEETNESQTVTYKAVDLNPILSGIRDTFGFFRTHAAAVWYNKLAGKTMRDKIEEMDAQIKQFEKYGKPHIFAENLKNGWRTNGNSIYVEISNLLLITSFIRDGATDSGTVIADGLPIGYVGGCTSPCLHAAGGLIDIQGDGIIRINTKIPESWACINIIAIKK